MKTVEKPFNRIQKVFSLILFLLIFVILLACEEDVDSPGLMSLDTILPDTVSAGDTVTLSGFGFGEEQGANRVLFGEEAAASYALWNDSIIVVTVPDIPGTVDVTVEIDGTGSNAIALSRGAAEVVYTLSSVYPSSGEAGDLVTLSGNLFSASRGENNVYFGNVPAIDYRLWSDNTIITVVPDNAFSREVKVSVDEIDSNTLDFVILPAIDSIQPGVVSRGDVISVIGTGFGEEQQSLFVGNMEADSFFSWTNKVIVARVPEFTSVGSNDVFVRMQDSTSNIARLNVLWDGITSSEGLNNDNLYGVLIEGDNLWISTWGGGINYSGDKGQSWQVFNTAAGLPTNNIRQVALRNDDLWVATYSGVCFSDDSGASWTRYTTADGLGNNNILSLEVDQNTGSIWAGTNNGGLGKLENGEAVWTTYSTSEGLAGNYVYDIYIESDSTVWAATNGGVAYSEDNGASWNKFTTANGLSYNACRALYADENVIWVGTTSRLNKSTDGGQTWTWYSSLEGLGGNSCLSILVSDDTVWVGTNGYGLSRTQDEGNSWETFSTADGLESNLIRAISVSGQEIAVGTNAGLSIAAK